MGWNDRLPTDPYLPPDDYYRNGEEEYHAWLEYVEMRLNEKSLTSQNIDPANLPATSTPEAPKRYKIMSRLWAAIFGQEVSKNQEQENQRSGQTEDTNVPF